MQRPEQQGSVRTHLMRRDSLRQRMGWLHAWIGFSAGLILVVIFTCGALAVYDTELTRWMQPELSPEPIGSLRPSSLTQALHEVNRLRVQGRTPVLILPSDRNPFLHVVTYNGTAYFGPVYDPASGDCLSERRTYGGTFFFIFHHGFFLPKPWGSIPSEIAGLALLVTVGSGVVIHLKKILPDFLLLRLGGPTQRGWTDAHILMGLLLLPFMVMMAYTGTATHAVRLFPAMSSHGAHVPRMSIAHDARTVIPDTLWAQLLQAERAYGRGHVGVITFKPHETLFTRSDMSRTVMTRDAIAFSPNVQKGRLTSPAKKGTNVKGWLAGFHFARWAPYPVRFCYFIGGLASSWLMSAGIILFLLKRRVQNAHRLGFRVGDALTLCVTVGLPLSAIAFLDSSRLPVKNEISRAQTEVTLFFIVWLATFCHALVLTLYGRPTRAWQAQLNTLGCAALTLPILDVMTRASPLTQASPIYAAVDGVAVIVGLCALICAKCVSKRCI